MNPHHLLVVFNKLITLGSSKASGYNISANGSDVDRGCIAGHGQRFIKLSPHSFNLVIDKTLNKAFLEDKGGKRCVINQHDVDIIKELETNTIIWVSPRARQIVIELDPASRPRPRIVNLPNQGPAVIQLDKNNCIPKAWTEGLDLQKFPLFVKLHQGITFREFDSLRLEWEFIGDQCWLDKFYVLQVYEKNGGKVLWQKPKKP